MPLITCGNMWGLAADGWLIQQLLDCTIITSRGLQFWHQCTLISGWPVDEWPKEVLCLRSIFLPKEVYFWPWKKYKSRKKHIFRQNYLWITPFLAINFHEIFYQLYIYNIRNNKVAGIIWHWFLTNSSQQNFNRQYFTFLVFFVCKILFFGPKIVIKWSNFIIL